MNVGLFFGSFNPIHIGHMIIANLVRELTDRDEIWFVVSPQNPFKKSGNLLHEHDRYDMVKAAVNDEYKFKVSDIEFRLDKPSYTINTLVNFQEKHPDHSFKLIIGEDNLASFPKWKNHQQILLNHGLIVYPRPKVSGSALVSDENVEMIEAPKMDVSATLIRTLVKTQKSIKYLVPDSVASMIEARGFYR